VLCCNLIYCCDQGNTDLLIEYVKVVNLLHIYSNFSKTCISVLGE
jgi:hypothetical protein